MLVWCGILFALGITAFMDSLFNYGEIFRQVNSVLFLLVSLGLLVRTTTKIRAAAKERQSERMANMESELAVLRREIAETAHKHTRRPRTADSF